MSDHPPMHTEGRVTPAMIAAGLARLRALGEPRRLIDRALAEQAVAAIWTGMDAVAVRAPESLHEASESRYRRALAACCMAMHSSAGELEEPCSAEAWERALNEADELLASETPTATPAGEQALVRRDPMSAPRPVEVCAHSQ